MRSGIPKGLPGTSWSRRPTIRSSTPRHRLWTPSTRTARITTRGWHWMPAPCAVVLAWTALGLTVTTPTATTAETYGSALKKYSEITGLCHG